MLTCNSFYKVSSASALSSPEGHGLIAWTATVFFFHQLYLIDDDLVENLMNKLCEMLEDSVVSADPCLLEGANRLTRTPNQIEVRESAATTLSGFVRCSQRKAVLSLKVSPSAADSFE